jgi:hypothetical protein
LDDRLQFERFQRFDRLAAQGHLLLHGLGTQVRQRPGGDEDARSHVVDKALHNICIACATQCPGGASEPIVDVAELVSLRSGTAERNCFAYASYTHSRLMNGFFRATAYQAKLSNKFLNVL